MRICENTDSRVEIMRVMDTHSSYWADAGLTGDIYYCLRSAFVKSLLTNTGFCCNEIEPGIYEIKY